MVVFELGGEIGDGGRDGVIRALQAVIDLFELLLPEPDRRTLDPLRYELESLADLDHGTEREIHRRASVGRMNRCPDANKSREFKTAVVLCAECLAETANPNPEKAYEAIKDKALAAAGYLGISMPAALKKWRDKMSRKPKWVGPENLGPLLEQRLLLARVRGFDRSWPWCRMP